MQSLVADFLDQQKQNFQSMSRNNDPPGLGIMQGFFNRLKNLVLIEKPDVMSRVSQICNKWEFAGMISAEKKSGSDINWPAILDQLFAELKAAVL